MATKKIECPVCHKKFAPQGYYKHEAMHNREQQRPDARPNGGASIVLHREAVLDEVTLKVKALLSIAREMSHSGLSLEQVVNALK